MFQFSRKKTGGYRNINPAMRLIIPLLISVLGFMYTQHLFLIGLIILVVFLLIVGKVEVKTILTYAKMLLTMIPFISIIWIFFNSEGDLIFKWHFIDIYSEGLRMAGIMALRFISIILSIPLLLGSLTQEEFVIALRKLYLPHVLVVIITMAFKLLPTMETDMGIIKQAQMSRGIEFENIKMREKIKNYVLLFVPLLTITVNRMETMSKVIECRGVSYKCKKTFYKNIKFKLLDYVLMLVTLTIFVVSIYMRGVI